MSEDIHSTMVLPERPGGNVENRAQEIGAYRENETDACLPKNNLPENCGSLNAESASISLTPCQVDVISVGNRKKNSTSQHCLPVAKETDGGWGWVIVVGVFFITLLVGGMNVAFSLLYSEFVHLFDASRAVAGWVGSLFIFTTHILGIFISVAITRYGSRIVCIVGSIIGLAGFALGSCGTSIVHMYLTLGIVAGSGSGMMMISSMVLLQQYFNRRRALAVSIASVGFSVGGLSFAPLTAWLLEKYGFRGTLLIHAGLFFQISVFGCLFRPAPGHSQVTSEKKKSSSVDRDKHEMELIVESETSSKLPQNDKDTIEQSFLDADNNDQPSRSRAARLLSWFGQLFADLFDFSLLRRVPFQLFLFSTFCVFVGFSSFLQHIPSRAKHFGVEQWLIAVLPSLICSASGVSRIVFGFIANMSCTSLVLQYAISVTVSGIIQITTWLATTFETMALYCVVMGCINGGFFTTLPTALVELNGIEHIVKSMAIWTFAVGIACLIGTPFSGFMFDVTGNYDIPFFVCGSIQTLGGLCAICVFVMRRCQKETKQP